jgi:glycosyltransferase involved in cell wall biosynthesis
MSQPISVIIPCKNESEQLAACITSARELADEILVADSGSSDGSMEIAQAMGARVIEREYRTYGDFQNWAIPQAAHAWVLVLDSDERVTPALAAEIRCVLDNDTQQTDPQHTGYSIPRRNHFLGHPIRFGPWMHDHCTRSSAAVRSVCSRIISFITPARRTNNTCRSCSVTRRCRRGFGISKGGERTRCKCSCAGRCDSCRDTSADSAFSTAWRGSRSAC